MTIGEKIRQRRIELNMTQDELAKKVGYKSRSSIQKIEVARALPLKKVSKMALALDCSPSYLMEWNDDANPIDLNNDEPWNDFTELERSIIRAYRKADDIDRRSILRILGLENNKEKESSLGA